MPRSGSCSRSRRPTSTRSASASALDADPDARPVQALRRDPRPVVRGHVGPPDRDRGRARALRRRGPACRDHPRPAAARVHGLARVATARVGAARRADRAARARGAAAGRPGVARHASASPTSANGSSSRRPTRRSASSTWSRGWPPTRMPPAETSRSSGSRSRARWPAIPGPWSRWAPTPTSPTR